MVLPDGSFNIPIGRPVASGEVIRVYTEVTRDGEEMRSDTVVMAGGRGQIGIVPGRDSVRGPSSRPSGFLPQTSSADTITLTAIGLGLIGLAGALFFKNKKRKNQV